MALAQAEDSAIRASAVREERILVTLDDDFQHFAIRPGTTTPVVWVRWGNTRRAALLNTLVPVWLAVVDQLRQGGRVVGIRQPYR